jgi:hypothetical protein
LSGDHKDVAGADHGFRGGVLEAGAWPFDPDDDHAVVLAQPALRERFADRFLRCAGFDDGEVVLELDVVQHPTRDQVRDPLAHVVLRKDDAMRPDSFQDACVLPVDGLGPDVRDLEVRQQRGGEDAGLNIAADTHHRTVELTELSQGFLVRGVRDRGVGELIREALHELGIVVDGEHLAARFGQLDRE